MDSIVVFEPGSTVRIGGDIPAQVAQVCIRQGRSVQYQVEWWDGRTRHCEWLEAGSVQGGENGSSSSVRVGFMAGD